MTHDAEHERAREAAQELARAAQERAKADAERLKAEALPLTGPMAREVLGRLGLIYGGLILIGVYMVQPFLTAPSLDASAKVSVIAFSVAIPPLAALVMVNRQEAFPSPADLIRHRHDRAGGGPAGGLRRDRRRLLATSRRSPG
jgi:hypothetical protein